MNLLKIGISNFFIIRTISTIFLFATIKLEAVSQNQFKDQGKGKVILKWYLTPLDNPQVNELYLQYVYYIKSNLVLQKDTIYDENIRKDNLINKGELTVNITNPGYIINLTKKLVRSDLKEVPSKMKDVALLNFGPELFYKALISPPVVTQIDTTSHVTTFTIAGLECFKGSANLMNSNFEFFYTKSRTNVLSPLNSFIPNFPFQILRIKIPLDNNPNAISDFIVESICAEIPKDIEDLIKW